jgi:hypothetical protein
MKKIIIPVALLALVACNKAEPKEDFKTDMKENSVYSSILLNDANEPFEDGEADPALVDWLFDDVLKNPSADVYSTDDKKMSLEDIEATLNRVIPAMKENPEKPGEFIETTDTIRIAKKDVVEIIMKESWEIDKASMKMKKQVEKIAPVVYVFDNDGDLKGKMMLFWIKMK